ncbi:unnamed protein product [Psylliodes chrysocephalus]|uniref:Uncharacterized protein n=1 Tax=Psylliodes chrysocephalus TaxID=3402493 RepID=A0A9P0GJ19_9CUCU|nr:unnamed protein product [Psylliodes chrysocephala]
MFTLTRIYNMVRIEDNDSPQEDSSGSQMNIEFNPIIELWPELTLEEKVDKAWRKISHEVPKKRNPLKATTHDFKLVPLGLCMMVWFVIAAANTFIEWQPDYFKRGTRYCNYYFFNSSVAILFLQLVFNLLLMFYVSIKFSFYD